MNYNQGVQISFKNKPTSSQYVGPSQLGYNNSNAYTPIYQKENPVSTSQSPKNGTILFQNVAIVSKKANRVLDICQDKQKKGLLIIYDDCNQPNQRFDIRAVGDCVQIISRQNGKLLTVSGSSQKNGAPILQEQVSGLIGQKFRLAPLQNKDEYLIHTFCGKVLDCCEQSISNGTAVIQWSCDRKQHQKWVIKK